MKRNEILNEIKRLEKMNEQFEKGYQPYNTQFYVQINNNEIKRLKKMLDI